MKLHPFSTISISLAVLAALLVPCLAQTKTKKGPAVLKLTSPAFEEGGMIPKDYTADGKNISPPLHIEGVTPETKSLVLIVDDPDAPNGTWTHWLVWNIDPKTKDIPEGAVPVDAQQGTNDFGDAKYGGPNPPSGTHRYFFKLYALDVPLKASPGAKRREVLVDLNKRTPVGEAKLMGKYGK